MAKTTRMALSFHAPGGQVDPAAAAAAVELPLVSVIAAERYAATGALGEVAPVREARFEAWDNDVTRRYDEHMKL
ncbi:hypothetical protein SMA90_33740, partial [Escherichia coli]